MSAVLRILRAPVVQSTVQRVGTRTMAGTGPGFTYGPPKVRIPLAEKLASAALLGTGVLAGPVYISLNLKNYRGE